MPRRGVWWCSQATVLVGPTCRLEGGNVGRMERGVGAM